GATAAGEHALLRQHGDAGPRPAVGAAGGGGGRAPPAAAARAQQGVARRHPAHAGGAAAVLVVEGLVCGHKPRRSNAWVLPRPPALTPPRLPPLLLPPAHAAAGARRGALRRNPPPDAGRRPLGRAGAARAGLPRQAAAVLLAGDGQLPAV